MSEAALRAAIFPLVRGLWRTRVVRGGESLSEEACFLYGNHSNNYDPFMVNWDLPLGACSSGVLTAEYMQKGVAAAALKGIGLLATRKRVPEPHLVGKILRLLRGGRNVLIYPEGGRRWDGRPARWIESTAKLFCRAGVPVRPVLVHGSYVAWPRWATWPRPARIEVEVLEPIPLDRGLSTHDAIIRLAAAIDIDENEPPIQTRPTWAFRPADGIHRLLYRDPVTGESGGLHTPDGYQITNVDGSVRWRMLPDSRIRDEGTGDILLTGDLYQKIRAFPLAGHDGLVVRNIVEVAIGPAMGQLDSKGKTEVALFADRIELKSSRMARVIPLEDVLFEGVEKNFKLQLTLRDELIEFRFSTHGSALQWEDSLFALKSGAS